MKWSFLCPALAAVLFSGMAYAQWIPNTGQTITPTAPAGSRYELLNPGLADFPNFVAGQAATTLVSPDKNTLLILTSGYKQHEDWFTYCV